MLKFVLDVGVGHKVSAFLTENGYDVLSILDIDPAMPDADILVIAERDQRMVVTMDKDFGELAYRSRQKHEGILLLRLEDASGDEKANVIREILGKYADDISGKFCVYQNGRLRIRG